MNIRGYICTCLALFFIFVFTRLLEYQILQFHTFFVLYRFHFGVGWLDRYYMFYKMPVIYSVSLLNKEEQIYSLSNNNDKKDNKTIKLNPKYSNRVKHLIQLGNRKEYYYEYMFNIFNDNILGEPLFLSPLEPERLIEWEK